MNLLNHLCACFIKIPDFKKVVVARVLTAQVVRTQAYKFDAAVRFANARLSDLRTEERRKVTIYSFHVPLNMYIIIMQMLNSV